MKYIYTHLGLGDHIICNGLVRSLINENEEYSLFVKSHNRNTVEFMFRDLTNIEYIEGDDSFVNYYLETHNIKSDDVIVAGFYTHPSSKEFDESFYLQNNLDFNLRWDNFKVERDINSELELFKKYNVVENEYVFIHDDSGRSLIIDEFHIINKDLPIIKPIFGLTNNVFDYCYLMQNSKESHFIDSSFRLIFDSLLLRNENIFYHINLLNGVVRDSTSSHSKLNFKII